MPTAIDLGKFKNIAKLTNRYEKQLLRLKKSEIPTDCIETAVTGATENLALANTSALVIYGEPQSGKTEMMICLTAKLLDSGHKIIVHLMNDSVDLLSQNLKRFKASGLAPAARNFSELLQSNKNSSQLPQELVVFCKKNSKDLEKLISRIGALGKIVVIDDEADYATPNSAINSKTKTPINQLVEQLIGNGVYIGVTATPARLDLNHTFNNDTEKWVNFPAHAKYTGQDVFFPLDKKYPYRLKLLDQSGTPKEAKDALVRFLVTSAYLNVHVNGTEKSYTMLVHTSGRKLDHEADRETIENAVHSIIHPDSEEFGDLVATIYQTATDLYPEVDPDKITEYVVSNASRTTLVVLNSERDRTAAGDTATEPVSPFTIIIGGNIVSRGVTFPDLLAMFFTRNVKHKLQQDTYIQRARMFGARGPFLQHFELTIPRQLYADWHRCFIFHRLALKTVNSLGSPIWLADKRVSVTAAPSVDKATVMFDKGEMSFGICDFTYDLDEIVLEDQSSIATLKKLQEKIGETALPKFLIDFLESMLMSDPNSLAIHSSSSIEGYRDNSNIDKKSISRRKGFIGKSQLEARKFPDAIHHIKILYNEEKKAKLFYKCQNNVQFIQSM